MSVDFSLPLPPPCVSPFLPVPSQWPQGLTQPLLHISEDHKPPPTPALRTFYNPTLGAPSHPQGAPGPVEIVLAGLQEEEAMCDSSFQTAALPAGLTARRPHEAAGTRPREASSPPAASGPADSEPGSPPRGVCWCSWVGRRLPSGTRLAPTPIPVWAGQECFLPSVP